MQTHVGESSYADTVLVAPYHVWGLVSRIDRVPEWAPSVVHCCIVENAAHPCAVGCIRRSLFHFGPFEGTVLREALTTIEHQGPHQWSLTLQLLHTDSDSKSPLVHQSLVQSATTTWRLQAVSSDPNKTFVSVSTVYQIQQHGGAEYREADAASVQEVTSFFDWWCKTQHEQLSDYVIGVAYPIREGRLTVERRQQYEAFEAAVVSLAVRSDIDLTTRQATDSLLQSWVRETRLSDQKDLLITHLRLEIASARRIAEAASITSAAKVETTPPSAEGNSEPQPNVDAPPPAQCSSRPVSSTTADIPRPPSTSAAAANASPYAPPPVRFDPVALSKAVTKGVLNEEVARRAFQQLDRQQRGWIDSDELAVVLASVEHFGAFEDKDGTFHRIEASREAAKQPLATLSSEKSGSSLDAGSLTPREKERRRKEHRDAELVRAMKRHAEQWIAKYARKSRGHLHFDEFCLLLLQLSLA